MPAVKLLTKVVEKPWGRTDRQAPFADLPPRQQPVGEIWFEKPDAQPELLVKYLFTSERLSIQVHPNDEAARSAGYRRGKDEAWLVLSAEPGAEIGIGLRKAISKEALRTAALDGTIEELVDWRPVAAGDFYYSPAGTVHAIGKGVVLIEVQQNVDLTYRLYDYGRPRELHLDEGIAVATAAPYQGLARSGPGRLGRDILATGPAFVVERWRGEFEGRVAAPGGIWLVPIGGEARVDSQIAAPGSVWLLEGQGKIDLGRGADLLVAYAGSEAIGLDG